MLMGVVCNRLALIVASSAVPCRVQLMGDVPAVCEQVITPKTHVDFIT